MERQPTKSILATGDQPVSFVELFFDLVFVYAITQVVHLMHGYFDWVHVGKAILVFGWSGGPGHNSRGHLMQPILKIILCSSERWPQQPLRFLWQSVCQNHLQDHLYGLQ